VRAALGDDIPLLLDSGIRSGLDVVAAIAAGASAVCVGTAITHPATITSWFARSLAEARH
ncbi:alpha-hydroxy-acid oxidizing protein, partial [Salmonella enterica]|uniref:alpha-hydroxy-acid oxidizing protein n=1 Tax=Salmonella enterica TaxID=28901 RepID=UPI001B2FF74C|nr:alpha-hydroxy-acid oxidizing protein [Salmonella enterica subsp. enterica serovar Typhimurium]